MTKDGITRRGAIVGLAGATATQAADAASFAELTGRAAANFFGTAQYGSLAAAIAAAESVTATGELFAVDDGKNNLMFRARQAGGSVEVARTVTPAALADPDIGPRMLRFRQPLPRAVEAPAYHKLQDFVSITDFDPDAGKGGDDRPAIQSMLDDIASVGKGRAYLPRPQATWKIGSGLDIDIAKVAITSDGGVIDAAEMKIGAALRVFGTEIPYFQSQNALHGIALRGPRWDGKAGKAASNVDGVLFDTATAEGASSHINAFAGNIYGFRHGATFGEHCYMVHLYGWDFWYNGVCLYAPPPKLNDSGENVRLYGGALYNSQLAIRLDAPNMDLFTDGTSIDYNADIADIRAGRWFHRGHIEAATYARAPMRVAASNGAGINLIDGHMLLRDGPNHDMPTFFEIGTGGFVVLGDLFAHNLLTASKQWYTGDGDFHITGRLSGFGIIGLPTVPNRQRGRILDPEFKAADIIDNVWISAGAEIATRFRSASGTISLEDGKLKITKSTRPGSLFQVSIAVPCSGGEAIGAVLAYSKNPGMRTSQPLYVAMSYVALRFEPLPRVMKSDNFAVVSFDLDEGALPTKELQFQGNIAERAEGWANHAVIDLNFIGASAGDFFIEFIQMDKFA